MNLRKLALAPAALALGLGIAAPAHAGAGDKTVVLSAVHCHPVVCVQHKVVTEWNGNGPLVLKFRRTEPVDTRTSDLPTRVQHWTEWQIVSVA